MSDWRDIELRNPVLGVSETFSGDEQPPLTMPDALNWRPFCSWTGRQEPAQRSGLSKFLSAQISGPNPVQALATIQKFEDRLGNFAVHAAGSSVTVDWSARLHAKTSTGGGDNLTGLAIDPVSGDLYALAGDTGLIRLNDDGEERYLVGVKLRLIDLVCKQVRLDGVGGVYICTAGAGTDGEIHKYRITDRGFEYQWTITAPNGGLFADINVTAEALYAVENVFPPNSHVHRFEGLDSAAPQLVWTVDEDQAGSDIEIGPDGVIFVSFLRDGTTKTPKVVKYSPAGKELWTHQPAGQGGHGYGSVFWNGYLYTVGPNLNGLGAWTDTKTVKRLVDNGSSVTVDWFINDASAPATDFQSRSIAVDKGGGLWRTVNGATSTSLQYISAAGSVVWSHTGATNDLGEPDRIEIDPDYPPGETSPQYVYVGGTQRSSDTKALFKLQVGAFASAITDSSARTTVRGALCNGTFKTFTTSGTATPSGGLSAMNTSLRYARLLPGFRKIYLFDGDSDKVYDPVADTVTKWRATRGRLPKRCKLKMVHGGRMYHAADPLNPQQWYASALGDPDDYDFFPVDPTPTQAISGADPRVGNCPDVINALIPWLDGVGLFGCDHSIWAMIGDPADGGRFDVVSDVVGMAFGDAWAKRPDGVLYFFGSRGGVYALAPGGKPARLVGRQDINGVNSIDARLNAVNLTTHKVMLAWNDAERTLHVFITPYSQGTTTHYVWNDAQGGWSIDQFPAAHGPTCVEVSDGDLPADRVLLLGGFDGQVRKWDSAATSDDGTAITSFGVYGPITAGQNLEIGFGRLRAVISDVTSGQTVGYSVFTAETAVWADAGAAKFSGTWAAGRNSRNNEKARGHAAWLKVGRFGVGQAVGRWSVQSIAGATRVEGMVRNR